MKRKNYFGISAMLIGIFSLLLLAGCPQEPEQKPDPVYGMTVDKPETLVLVEHLASGDITTELATVTVTNTGDTPLKDLTVTLASASDDENADDYFDYEFFMVNESMDPVSLEEIPAGGTKTFVVGWTGPGQMVHVYKARAVIKNSHVEKVAAFSVGVFELTEDTGMSHTPAAEIEAGATGISVSTTAAVKGEHPWFSSNTSVITVDPASGALTIQGTGYAIIGYMSSEAPFTVMGKRLTVYQDYDPPEIVSAVVDIGTATTLTVTFDKAVSFTGISGFSLNGSETATTLVSAVADQEDRAKMLFTLNLKPRFADSDTFKLSYDANAGTVKIYNENTKDPPVWLQSVAGQDITLTGFTAITDAPPAVEKIEVDAKRSGTAFSEEDAKKVYVTFTKEVSFSNEGGFTPVGSFDVERVIGFISDPSDAKTLILTLNNWASWTDKDTFKLRYDKSLGTVKDNDGNLLEDFEQAISLVNYDEKNNVDTIPPKIVSGLITDANRGILRLVFNKPVTLDASKFEVKVHGSTWIDYSKATVSAWGNTMMDVGITKRTVSGVAAVADTNDTTWDLTMSESAKHGEIIRVATTEAGAAKSVPANIDLPVIPQFIVRSEVRREKATYEAEPGFYRNGVKDESITDANGDNTSGQMYNNILRASKLGTASGTHADHPKAGEIITIVLDTDQYASVNGPYSSYSHVTALQDKQFDGATIIFTTTTANATSANPKKVTIYVGNITPRFAQNNITMIIDEHIVFTRDPKVASRSGPLVYLGDGGKLILDGGEIKDNVASMAGGGGAITMGGGSYGGIFVFNRGKITNNAVTDTLGSGNTNSTAGAILLSQYGFVVMHDGEITGNTLNVTAAPGSPRGAAISCFNNTSANHGKSAFYMTGGTISGSQVTGSGSVSSAGAIVVNGTFMKVGGTIYGSTAADQAQANTTTLTGNVNPGAVLVLNKIGSNLAAADVTKRDATTGPADTLFLDSAKPSNGAVGVNTIPDWVDSFWDAPPEPEPEPEV